MPELDQNHRVLAPQPLELCDRGAEFGTNLDELCAGRRRRSVPRRRRLVALFRAHSAAPAARSQGRLVRRLFAYASQTITRVASFILKTTPTERTGATTNVPDRTRKTPMSGEVGEATHGRPSTQSEWRPSPKRYR